MWKKRLSAIILLILAFGVAYYAYNQSSPYKLGLDLSGGTHLVFNADTSNIPPAEVNDAMTSLADVVERRVNTFGVSEPIVQVETGGVIGETAHRLIVELPGITDVTQAVDLIGKTPVLDFRLEKPSTENLTSAQKANMTLDQLFVTTGLTGRYLVHAALEFDPTTYAPQVSLTFNSDGAKLFSQITKDNIGKVLAVFLDGQPISTPVIQTEIDSGQAVINGSFTVDQAKTLVRDLNLGALPVPISLASTQTIGATLGQGALDASVFAGIIAYIAVGLFLLLWYRLPGLIATIALAIYVALNLALFKLIPVTLTAAGIAGFVLTLGMAVDANILIFERMKEELRRGLALPDAIKEGFHRAWLSIRDSNLSSIITAIILYYFASTPIIQGFALVFGLGVLVSMFTAITASRTLLMAAGVKGEGRAARFFFSSGITR
ncbi:MAG: protein translocase subunit SecD [Patescibacteria group bacterium]|nr:protein translocase subunit SecD [Patescibacteria group bacterium]MDE2116790.1 protein translocase subunit SecD [Patescibacteria group bacterium]